MNPHTTPTPAASGPSAPEAAQISNRLDDDATDATESALGLREDYHDPEHYDRDFNARFMVERAKLEASTPEAAPKVTHTRQPYTVPQVLANLAEMDRQLDDFPTDSTDNGPAWVRGIVEDIIDRGIAPEPATGAATSQGGQKSVPYTPLPEAVALARLLSADTSQGGMAAVLSGFIRVRDKERERLECRIIDTEADLADCRATFDHTAAKLVTSQAALAHALAFIEHAFPFDGEPCDAFDHATDDGPVMECNLKLMRDALKEGK